MFVQHWFKAGPGEQIEAVVIPPIADYYGRIRHLGIAEFVFLHQSLLLLISTVLEIVLAILAPYPLRLIYRLIFAVSWMGATTT